MNLAKTICEVYLWLPDCITEDDRINLASLRQAVNKHRQFLDNGLLVLVVNELYEATEGRDKDKQGRLAIHALEMMKCEIQDVIDAINTQGE